MHYNTGKANDSGQPREANSGAANRVVNVVTSSRGVARGSLGGLAGVTEVLSLYKEFHKNNAGVLVRGCFGGTNVATNGLSISLLMPPSTVKVTRRPLRPSPLIGSTSRGDASLCFPLRSTASCLHCLRPALPGGRHPQRAASLLCNVFSRKQEETSEVWAKFDFVEPKSFKALLDSF